MKKDASKYVKWAREVFEIESRAIHDLSKSLNKDFESAIELILKTRGRVIVSGVGKSGIVGRKIAATLASTGTPSIFMHPVEAFHGDLGMMRKEDVVIGISYSGETEELLKVIPFFKLNGIKLIAITGNIKSTLSKNSDAVLNVQVHKEACPLELAPTSSTTATIAMGDALAVALMKARDFKKEDFAQYHPGGSLGRKLLTTVEDAMYKDNLPLVKSDDQMKQVIAAMTKGRLGLAVVHENKTIKGIITDGDLRRSMERHGAGFFNLKAKEIMTREPKMITSDMKMAEAEELMSQLKVTSLIVHKQKKIAGIVQLYSIK